MKLTTPSWCGGVVLGFALAVAIAPVPAYAQLVSTATNDAYANNTALRFNYAEALQKSLYFLEAQQNGPLSPNNRVVWRGNANLSDGSDIGRDLAGGLYDAGDHWTTNTTMAFVTTTVAWSAVEKPTGWTSTGQMDELLESLVTVNNYFIKCVLNPTVTNPAQNLEVVIGCGGREGVPDPGVHGIWAGAEMASAINLTTGQRFTNRPTFRLNATAPGGDIPAAMASAMAASSMVIRTHGDLLAGKNGFASFNPTAYADQIYDLASNGSGDLLTPAGDGVPNLLKYAFNLLGTGAGQASVLATPNASLLTANGTADLPLVGIESATGKLQLTYIRRKASSSPGVTYAVEFSDALASWAVNGSATESATSIDTSFDRVTVTDSLATSATRFVCVKVSVPWRTLFSVVNAADSKT